MKHITDAFYKSGLLMEFLETLINDKSIPEKLRRQVWTLMSTTWDLQEEITTNLADAFADSTDELDLTTLWEPIVKHAWSNFPECLLKAEIDGRTREVIL